MKPLRSSASWWIDKICELGRVIISAQYMFQSYGMPRELDGSGEEVCVCLSLYSHHVLYTQDEDAAGSSDDDVVSNYGSVNDLHA